MMLFKILLLLLLLLTATSLSTDQQYKWRPQGRFGKREGPDSKFTPHFDVQMTPIRGKHYAFIHRIRKIDLMNVLFVIK